MTSMNLNGTITWEGQKYSKEEIKHHVHTIRLIIDYVNTPKDQIIAIVMPRAQYFFFTLYALFMSEIPFLIIDLTLPQERINYMLTHCKIKTILSLSSVSSNFEGYSVIPIDEYEKKVDINQTPTSHHSQRAYVLFTSGTTGNPKAVSIYRKGLLNLIHAIPKEIPFTSNMNMASFTNISFDIFLLEVFVFMTCCKMKLN